MMTTTLRISFLLPGAGSLPVGGFKVVYEYANRLARRGHQVTVVHPALGQKDAVPTEVLRSVFRYIYRKTLGEFAPQRWFRMDPSVRLLWVPSLSGKHIPDGDVVIATAWQTAEWAAELPRSKGNKAYLIQQLEMWHGMDHRAEATWRLPLRKFVISQWLMEVAESQGLNASYQPNGLDFEQFALTRGLDARNPHTALMLYHTAQNKGSVDGLTALSIVHQWIPELRVTLFGTPRKPKNLPSWIHYHRCPDQRFLCELYNSAAVFVAPSWSEGWALPPAEAMMCGAAVAATDIGGHRGYAIDGETALLSPPKQPNHLAENILRLMRDNALRKRIAMAGYGNIQQFTWERSVNLIEAALLDDYAAQGSGK